MCVLGSGLYPDRIPTPSRLAKSGAKRCTIGVRLRFDSSHHCSCSKCGDNHYCYHQHFLKESSATRTIQLFIIQCILSQNQNVWNFVQSLFLQCCDHKDEVVIIISWWHYDDDGGSYHMMMIFLIITIGMTIFKTTLLTSSLSCFPKSLDTIIADFFFNDSYQIRQTLSQQSP